MSHDAEAVEITTITKAIEKLCIGSDIAGTIVGEELGWKAVLTDGKVTDFSISETQAFKDQMDNPLNGGDYNARVHRNFVYTQWPANNGMIEGCYLYNITDPANVKKSFVINSKNYPDYNTSTIVHFIKGATPDQDRMVFLNPKISAYKSPFDTNGNVKAEYKTGPVLPDFTYDIAQDWSSLKATDNFIFILDSGNNPTIHKLIIEQNGITEDPVVLTINGIKAYDWSIMKSGFLATKDANGTPTIYLTVEGNKIVLVNINNLIDYKVTDADSDIAVEDPDSRYAFKAINNGGGKVDTYITDLWAKPQVNKKIITNNIFPLRGNLSYSTELNGWILYGKADKFGLNDQVYLIKIISPATMETEVTKIPFTTFKDNFAGAGEACVTIPGQVATVVKTGTPADAGDASVVENANEGATEGVVEAVEAVEVVEAAEKDMDAGTTEGVDGGGTDVAAEVIITPEVDGGSDAIDDWLDGKGDMSDISPDVAPDGEPDTMLDQSSTDTSEAATAAEVDGEVTPPDMSTNEITSPTDTQTADNVDTNDTAVPPVDTQKTDGIDTWLAGDAETMKEIFADAGSSETSRKPPVIAPAPKDTGCNATGTGNGNNGLTPLAIALGVGAAVGLARRREEGAESD